MRTSITIPHADLVSLVRYTSRPSHPLLKNRRCNWRFSPNLSAQVPRSHKATTLSGVEFSPSRLHSCFVSWRSLTGGGYHSSSHWQQIKKE